MPDRARFRALLDELFTDLRRGREPGARARGYGEMADLLWQDGNQRAAIRLEELWNELREGRPMAFLCAYTMGGMYREEDHEQFLDVCRQHQHVLPTERYVLLDESQRLREMTVLQRRAGALERELEHRRQVERALRQALRERVRMEQAISNMVGDALEQGAAEQPVTVTVRDVGDAVAVEVCNEDGSRSETRFPRR